MTAVGRVTVDRVYFTCPACGQGEFGADRVLGVGGFLTPRAERLAALAGVQQSFPAAERVLAELAGWSVDAETIRRLCHRTATAAADRLAAEEPAADPFAAAAGAWEVQIDAGKVNTDTGWRDVKVAVFAKRAAGPAATPADWADRDLPAPAIRRVVADITEAAAFGPRVAAEAGRLGLTDPAGATVLGDGADWVWGLAAGHLPGARGVLDIYHATEHLATAARAALGDAPDLAAVIDRGRGRLLADGYPGVADWIGELLGRMPAGGDGAAVGGRLNYFAGHRDRLGYADRLAAGASIGSGLVEGTIKQVVNQRLKQTGARWKADHVGPFVELKALVDSPWWAAFWETR